MLGELINACLLQDREGLGSLVAGALTLLHSHLHSGRIRAPSIRMRIPRSPMIIFSTLLCNHDRSFFHNVHRWLFPRLFLVELHRCRSLASPMRIVISDSTLSSPAAICVLTPLQQTSDMAMSQSSLPRDQLTGEVIDSVGHARVQSSAAPANKLSLLLSPRLTRVFFWS